MSVLDTIARLAYLLAAACFVLGLHQMNSPATARRGNRLSAIGMATAIGATILLIVREGNVSALGMALLAAATAIGAAAGLFAARTVRMTAVPQLVSLFNAVGGGAAALIAIHDLAGLTGSRAPAGTATAIALDVAIGAITFSGSLVASGKLQGVVPSRPVVFRHSRLLNLTVSAVMLAGIGGLISGVGGLITLIGLVLAALTVGVTMVLPIGGADMPVVIALLNACTGTAVAMAGIVIDNPVLIIGGALVGASGAILTTLMAHAMNRSLADIILGGFGTGDTTATAANAGADRHIRTTDADDAALQLAYARKVVIVPGYGLAAAQAQHAAGELARLLETRGTEVCYAIHPLAGRMPGHMNVLLAEANVPYSQLKEMDEINPEFPLTDVALVVGANDVTNPAARRAGTALSGMPILDVDHAKSVIVIKRSLGHGYAGIDNELYTNPKTALYLADAKAALLALTTAVNTLVR